MALAILQEVSGAMATEIVEAAQFTLPIADDEDPPAHDLGGDVVARVGQGCRRSDELPFAGEDRLALALEHIGAVIPLGGQAEVGAGFQ